MSVCRVRWSAALAPELYSTPVTSHLRWTAMCELRDDAITGSRRTTRPGPIESAADGASDGTR